MSNGDEMAHVKMKCTNPNLEKTKMGKLTVGEWKPEQAKSIKGNNNLKL